MGFKNGAWATVFGVEPVSEKWTKGRISVSRKDANTGEYVQEFGGFVDFMGAECASEAKNLNEKDRIRLLEVDVTRKYSTEEKREYVNYKIFSFDFGEDSNDTPKKKKPKEDEPSEYDGDDDQLPF